jgi:Replication-relaxation
MAGNSRTTLVLQERDRRLMEALQTMRVVDREQAKTVAGFHSTTRANARLLALTRAGLLRKAFIGNRQAVYWLANRELQKARKRGEAIPEPAVLFLRHRLEINRAHLLVEYRSIPVTGWRFGLWQSFQQPIDSAVPLIPDGYFELASARDVRAAFVEVDLGTEAIPVLVRKARLYLQYAASGEFTKTFGRSQFRVLVLTTSERRLTNIRSAVAKVTDKIFWFGTLDMVTAERFWAPVWSRPTGNQPQSFL